MGNAVFAFRMLNIFLNIVSNKMILPRVDLEARVTYSSRFDLLKNIAMTLSTGPLRGTTKKYSGKVHALGRFVWIVAIVVFFVVDIFFVPTDRKEMLYPYLLLELGILLELLQENQVLYAMSNSHLEILSKIEFYANLATNAVVFGLVYKRIVPDKYVLHMLAASKIFYSMLLAIMLRRQKWKPQYTDMWVDRDGLTKGLIKTFFDSVILPNIEKVILMMDKNHLTELVYNTISGYTYYIYTFVFTPVEEAVTAYYATPGQGPEFMSKIIRGVNIFGIFMVSFSECFREILVLGFSIVTDRSSIEDPEDFIWRLADSLAFHSILLYVSGLQGPMGRYSATLGDSRGFNLELKWIYFYSIFIYIPLLYLARRHVKGLISVRTINSMFHLSLVVASRWKDLEEGLLHDLLVDSGVTLGLWFIFVCIPKLLVPDMDLLVRFIIGSVGALLIIAYGWVRVYKGGKKEKKKVKED